MAAIGVGMPLRVDAQGFVGRGGMRAARAGRVDRSGQAYNAGGRGRTTAATAATAAAAAAATAGGRGAMAERSFAKEVKSLALGEGETFHGEGILAVAKALLESGVSYVGGYQGAPVSHMMDVFDDARPILDSLGVHVETCANEAAACAMLAASINYPVRGCAVWKSTVGTNVASDALSNLASAGVTGGALVVVGEDYGDGASIIQERSHAFAMKSQVWLLDPRPSLPAMVRAVKKGFELSEASNTPVMLELRIRACHVHGSFAAGTNRAPAWSSRRPLEGPRFDPERICLPPSTYLQEQKKVKERWPAAVEFVRAHGLNEYFPPLADEPAPVPVFDPAIGPASGIGSASDPGASSGSGPASGTGPAPTAPVRPGTGTGTEAGSAASAGIDADAIEDVGIVTQGGMYNAVLRALALLGFADAEGRARLPIFVLNVTYPLVPEEVAGFCAGKRAVLVVEEGQPAYLEEAIGSLLRKAGVGEGTRVVGKGPFPMAGEYTGEVVLRGVDAFLREALGHNRAPDSAVVGAVDDARRRAAELLGQPVPARPPGFCTGCPERPVFSALKIVEREAGPMHVSADIGCHTFSTLPPFHIGNTVLGYGLGLASAAAVGSHMGGKRTVSIMGDGGFWHNGLTSGVASAVFNRSDDVLIVMNNGYTSATGGQAIPSSVRVGAGGAGRNGSGGPARMDGCGGNGRAHANGSNGNTSGNGAAAAGAGAGGATRRFDEDRGAGGQSIEAALRGVGVKWVRRVRTYSVAKMVKTLRAALDGETKGLKVIVADGECQLMRQRRYRPWFARRLAAGRRVVRTRFGVDEDVCTGDHSCIRLSGCPSLTVKQSADPLRSDPVAHVDNDCVGCGLCGEVAHAAVLCPSFFRAEIVNNPSRWDRVLHGVRSRVIGALARA